MNARKFFFTKNKYKSIRAQVILVTGILKATVTVQQQKLFDHYMEGS